MHRHHAPCTTTCMCTTCPPPPGPQAPGLVLTREVHINLTDVHGGRRCALHPQRDVAPVAQALHRQRVHRLQRETRGAERVLVAGHHHLVAQAAAGRARWGVRVRGTYVCWSARAWHNSQPASCSQGQHASQQAPPGTQPCFTPALPERATKGELSARPGRAPHTSACNAPNVEVSLEGGGAIRDDHRGHGGGVAAGEQQAYLVCAESRMQAPSLAQPCCCWQSHAMQHTDFRSNRPSQLQPCCRHPTLTPTPPFAASPPHHHHHYHTHTTRPCLTPGQQ